jgi:NO-binding membrane sensor protein with MHYT domain
VAMLAYELDLQIGISVPWTLASSLLAVLFTFAALGLDQLWEAWYRERKGKNWVTRRKRTTKGSKTRGNGLTQDNDSRPLLNQSEEVEEDSPVDNSELTCFEIGQGSRLYRFESDENTLYDVESRAESSIPTVPLNGNDSASKPLSLPETSVSQLTAESTLHDHAESMTGFTESTENSFSRRSSALGSNSTTSYGLSSMMNIAYRSTSLPKNAFLATGEALYSGCTYKNMAKGFLWSLAITSMHYAGIFALSIPNGYCTLNWVLVILSGFISWCVCVVGCILMPQMETHLTQQFLFSAVATTGVAAMHFTGKIVQHLPVRTPKLMIV